MTEIGSRDWIELFLDYTAGIPSPRIFRQWAAISCVAGTLERRVWVTVAGKILFPNMYVLLVSNPGGGKTQAIEHTSDFWSNTPGLKTAPHDVTKAALIDALDAAKQTRIINDTKLVEYNSLLVAADEFGVLVPSHDLDFLSTLNRVYDNPPHHRQNRRGLKDQIEITNPQLNIVGGTQPAYLANLLPEQAWGMGFMSRIIMVYSAERPKVKLFGGAVELKKSIYAELITGLRNITKLYGQLPWEFPAAEAAERWNNSGLEPVPEHSKMEHYNSRRLAHVLKLSIVSAVSQGNSSISLIDFNRARDWLLEAEQTMPDVFRAMVQRSDAEVINELHFFAWQVWIKSKQPIHETRLINFMMNRVPSDKIPRILEMCVRASIFDRTAGTDTYVPRPKASHGTE